MNPFIKIPAPLTGLFLLTTGCLSNAGPFVTNISFDGDDNLIIEKCMAQFDSGLSGIYNTQCSSVSMKVGRVSGSGDLNGPRSQRTKELKEKADGSGHCMIRNRMVNASNPDCDGQEIIYP